MVDLYERGLYLQAHALAQRFGPLQHWRGTEPRVFAGRLAVHLGAGRLGRGLHLRAYRNAPADPQARYYFAWAVLERRGPLEAWRLLKNFGDARDAPPAVRSDLLALRSRAACLLRDFEAADACLAEADKIAPDRAWLLVERSFLLENQDRYEEALASARRALELSSWYRPAVQAFAHYLQLLDRNAEALQFLADTAQRLESGAVVAQLAALQVEMGLYADARKSWARCAGLSPLMEPEFAEWLATRRSDAAYFDGDFAEAAEFAKQVAHPLYQEMAARLPKVGGIGRVQLPVGFVRQHHMTCAPATLSALSRFWQMPAEHLSLAETICYDGTPAHSERQWAEQNGWRAREFTVTGESATALVDRRVPFTLTTVEPGSAHLQAVVGYDTLRGSLIVRDPFVHVLREFHAEKTFERYRSSGPRGMALAPAAQADLIDSLPLPEAELYDRFYQMQRALSGHDRSRALEWLEQMKAAAPAHRLTLTARRALAAYDADQTEILASVGQLLEQYPQDANLQLSRLSCLRELARRNERVAWLKGVCETKESDPLLWQEYAWELSADAREQDEAMRLLRRVLRARGPQANTLYVQANILWNQRQFVRATELYRFAACLDDKKEYLARAYFSAARFLKQTETALGFVVDRFRRFGKRSGEPALTLFWAHSELDQMTAAFLALESAIQLRPDDSQLRLFAADAYARYGDFERAEILLREAAGRSRSAAWLRTAAELASLRGELPKALELWRQVFQAEPLALDANRAIAQLLAQTESRAAALGHLEQVCSRFPHHFSLHQLWSQWLREDGGAAVEPVVRRLVEINPADAWARREIAVAQAKQRRFEEAFAEADHSIALDPNNSWGHSVRGWIARNAGQTAVARADFRRAIVLSVDNGDAINGLLETCDSLAEKGAAIAFVEQELIRQVVFGDGLLAFREVARRIMAPEELLASLRQAHRERPDLWHAWSALIQQLTDMQRLDEALALAREATGRFPLLPRLWLDLSLVHRVRLDRPREIEALEKAAQINPNFTFPARELALALERDGQLPRARTILEQAAARAPLDAFNHGCLAAVLWNLGEKKTALQRLQHALRLDPGYDWGWRTLRDWSAESGEPQLAARMARDLTERRAGEARSWLLLAESLNATEDLPEQLAALDRAAELNPRGVEAHDLRATLLARAKRFDEALAACCPAGWPGEPPTELRARAAWVDAQRGKISQAVGQMRAALAENPGLYWGWRDLAEWLWAEGNFKDAIGAAEKMAWLAPSSPVPLGYLGYAKLRLNDRAAAKADLQRAIELDPAYLFAASSLFDAQLADGELAAAETTLACFRNHAGKDHALARETQLAARRGDQAEALRTLHSLCLCQNPDPAEINTAAEAVLKAGWHRAAEALFAETMEMAAANPQTGALWVERRAGRGKLNCLRQLNRLQARGEIGRRATVSCLEALAEACQRFQARRDVFGPRKCRRLFRRVLRRHRDWLRANDWSWGKVGYAMTVLGRFREAERWLADWKNRPGAELWMLHNVVWVLQRKGRDAEASEIIRHGLTMPGRDGTQVRFGLWVAIEEALAGNVTAARERLSGLPGEKLENYDGALRALVTVLLHFQPPDGRRERFDKTHRRILRDFLNANRGNKTMVRVFHRSARLMARQSGSWWPIAWSFSQRYLPVAFGVLVAALIIVLNALANR